jgi:hypothetical protein
MATIETMLTMVEKVYIHTHIFLASVYYAAAINNIYSFLLVILPQSALEKLCKRYL